MQSHLLQGRVITTFGIREDRSFNQDGAAPKFIATPGRIDVDRDSLKV